MRPSQVSELLKLGSHSYDDLKQFTVSIEEKLFRMDALRDRSLTYKTEEIQVTLLNNLFIDLGSPHDPRLTYSRIQIN